MIDQEAGSVCEFFSKDAIKGLRHDYKWWAPGWRDRAD
jgi:hypothetical protein